MHQEKCISKNDVVDEGKDETIRTALEKKMVLKSFRFSVMCKESWHKFWDKLLNAGKDCRIK